jgi:hypothetical protein
MGVPVIYILAHLLLAVVAHVLRHCSEAAREWAAGGPTGNGGMRACAPARCTCTAYFPSGRTRKWRAEPVVAPQQQK